MMNDNFSAQQILDDIFTIMQQLYNEMRLNENSESNHLRIFDIFAQLGKTLASADRASFWRWDKDSHKLVTTAATGTGQIVIDDTTGLVGRALAENTPIVTNDPYHHPDFNPEVDRKTGYVTKSVLVMPVSNCRGEVIGAFQVINKMDGENAFDEVEDVKRLSIAAFICGMALESDIFLSESQHDKLTRLKNRFGFYADCQTKYRKMLQAPNREVPLSLVICDIDFFKKVNDVYGHNGGDAVLAHISNVLKSQIGTLGNVYRWGGEEFIIVLDEADLSHAAAIAERIRLAVEASSCAFENRDIKVTMSFGCTELEPKLTMEENVKIADERLYHAKKTGRNKVVDTDE